MRCGHTLASLDLDNGLAEVAKAVQVQARCISSRRHVNTSPSTRRPVRLRLATAINA